MRQGINEMLGHIVGELPYPIEKNVSFEEAMRNQIKTMLAGYVGQGIRLFKLAQWLTLPQLQYALRLIRQVKGNAWVELPCMDKPEYMMGHASYMMAMGEGAIRGLIVNFVPGCLLEFMTQLKRLFENECPKILVTSGLIKGICEVIEWPWINSLIGESQKAQVDGIIASPYEVFQIKRAGVDMVPVIFQKGYVTSSFRDGANFLIIKSIMDQETFTDLLGQVLTGLFQYRKQQSLSFLK